MYYLPLEQTADAVINTIEIRYKENENVEKQQLLKSVLKVIIINY